MVVDPVFGDLGGGGGGEYVPTFDDLGGGGEYVPTFDDLGGEYVPTFDDLGDAPTDVGECSSPPGTPPGCTSPPDSPPGTPPGTPPGCSSPPKSSSSSSIPGVRGSFAFDCAHPRRIYVPRSPTGGALRVYAPRSPPPSIA